MSQKFQMNQRSLKYQMFQMFQMSQKNQQVLLAVQQRSLRL
jgi:hypothetical protein